MRKRSGEEDDPPVELVDIFDVAEQRADLLWFQRQSAAVDDAAQVILQRHTVTPSSSSSHLHLPLCWSCSSRSSSDKAHGSFSGRVALRRSNKSEQRGNQKKIYTKRIRQEGETEQSWRRGSDLSQETRNQRPEELKNQTTGDLQNQSNEEPKN